MNKPSALHDFTVAQLARQQPQAVVATEATAAAAAEAALTQLQPPLAAESPHEEAPQPEASREGRSEPL